jgi:hypothetical protein
MVGRDVEELEVVLLGLDLRTLEDFEAVGVEDLAQVANRGEDRVEMADADRPARRAHIDRLARESRVEVAGTQLLEPAPDRRLELVADLVGALTDGPALVDGNRSELAQDRGQATRAAKQLVAQGIDVCRGGRAGQPLSACALYRVELGP